MQASQNVARRLPTPDDDSVKEGIIPSHVPREGLLKYDWPWRENGLDPTSYMKRVL